MFVFHKTSHVIGENFPFFTGPFVASGQHVELSNHFVLYATVAGEVSGLPAAVAGDSRLILVASLALLPILIIRSLVDVREVYSS
jgi:hypothetical protein